ncbi:MAG TPA: DNA polymerase IV [Capillimicrobium sp.]|nr:DNA polymerase IV [Capillimicrobium sp.]
MPPIAHLDMDAFYVSVELLRRPELRGKPVVVSGTGPRAVVTTASYEARKFGVGSAMPASRARRLCPHAIFLPPDFDAYRAVSRQVMGLLREHVERVEVVGLDEAYLDLEGLVAPNAAMRRLVAAIRQRTGLTASVGIGPNKLVAKVASDAEKPAGFVVLTREQACARFADRSPGLVPGIGPKTVERLRELGIETLGALAATPEQVLQDRFGRNHGRDLLARARFHGATQLTLERVAVSESRETTFPTDIADRSEQEAALRRLASELCASLKRPGRTIAIKVRLDDWTTVTRARTVAEPTRDAGVVSGVALDLLRAYAPPRPVRLLGVRVAGFDAPAPEVDAGQLALPM